MVLINPIVSFNDGIIKGFDWHLPPLRFCRPSFYSKMSNKVIYIKKNGIWSVPHFCGIVLDSRYRQQADPQEVEYCQRHDQPRGLSCPAFFSFSTQSSINSKFNLAFLGMAGSIW